MTRTLIAFFAAIATSTAAAEVDVAETNRLIIDGTNRFRAAEGLAPLSVNAALGDAAERFAGYMARTGKYGHTADGRRPAQRAVAEGYEYCIVGENIAYQYRSDGFGSAEALAEAFVEGWKHSPEHRENMLDDAVTQIGVGVAQAHDGRHFGVQMFGRPKSAAIRFEVENRAGERVGYRAGEQSFALQPRQTRTHILCRAVPLAIPRSPSREPFTAEIQDGKRYSIRDAGVAVEAAGAQ